MIIERREDFPRLFTQKNYKIGVELGSYKGYFANIILSNWDGNLVCIDLFDREDNSVLYKNDCFYTKDLAKNKLLKIFNKTLSKHKNRLLTIQSDTISSANFFPDSHFDFIYFDADHSYETVICELTTWYSKLKSGGLFCGHDFLPNFDYSKKNNTVYDPLDLTSYNGEFGVNTAVVEFCNQHRVTFNVTQEPYWRSWYFFKP